MPTFIRSWGIIALITMIAAAGCNKPEGEGKLLATVNGRAITQQDLDFSALPSGHGEARPVKDLAYLIDEELMSQQGHSIGLDRDPTYSKFQARLQQTGHGMASSSPERVRYVASQMRSEMARRVFDTQIASKVEVRQSEAREYFERNRETINTQLHLGLLKFQDKKNAEEALSKLRQGTAFEKLGGKPKGEETAVAAKDLGFVAWTDLPIDFVEPLYKLKPGESTSVMGSQQAGYQIIKLYASRKSPRELRFPDVATNIMNGLQDLKIIEEHHRYLAQLKQQAKIVTF
ncbi:MAG TPA: peptidylprolyl isomerase [Geomonas sp.]|nr:peptidylprolyl isomerase [Geomonas sp.]